MSKFIERVPQTSHVNVYYPGASECTGSSNCNGNTKVIPCQGNDWHFSDVTCKNGCPSQPACSEIDGNTCPSLGQNISYVWSGQFNSDQQPLVDCEYTPESFSYSDVVEYREQFGVTDNYNQVLLPSFCFKESTVCPNIPDTTKPWSKCPRILSNLNGDSSGNAGADCTTWASKNPKIADNAMSQFCSSSSGSNICSCVNRNNSAVFNYISSGLAERATFGGANSNLNGVDPSCWFVPCANPQAFLVPSSINNSECIDTCKIINTIISTVPTNLTLAQLQNEIECTLTATPTPVNPSSSSNNPSGSIFSTSSSSSGTTVLIIVGIILLIIFFVILAFLFLG